jgi:hypothetical protein
MKKLLLLLIFGIRICIAQQHVYTLPDPEIQNHVMTPQMDSYYWDTLANNWDYDRTFYMYYTGNLWTSSLGYDTVNALPLQHDTIAYDASGRVTLLQTEIYNGGWQNSLKTVHVYTDTTFENRTGFHYSGSGAIWDLTFADSVYTVRDLSGNIIEYHSYIYDQGSGTFEPAGLSLSDYDGLNRLQRNRNYTYDPLQAQYVINTLDSNYQYDAVFTKQVIDHIRYQYNSGNQEPFMRQLVQLAGTISDRTETTQFYSSILLQWENNARVTYTTQSCDNIDSVVFENWNGATSQWEHGNASRVIFNWTDSCDYDESISQDYIPYLVTYRNYHKWVYPVAQTSGIESPMSQAKIMLYPNPIHTTAKMSCSHQLQSAVSSPIDSQYQLRIYNTLGILIREEKILNLNSYILHRDELRDGMYFYELRTLDSELLGTGKFIVE